MARARTIQIFLPKGDPRGIRVAELTTSIVRVVEVPRALLADFLDMPEAGQVGVYFLVGGDESGEGQKLYIGQSGAVGERLAQHNKSKDFWNRALVVVSLTNNFTQTHALFLEWTSIQAATQAGRYGVENGNTGSRPHTPAPLQADCEDIHETAGTLLATLGFSIFDPVAQVAGNAKLAKQEQFLCKGVDADGVGLYTAEGFVVLKGSKARADIVPSMQDTSTARARTRLIDEGVLTPRDGALIFTKDHLFGSPSSAAIAVLGRSANGWLEWKRADGKTLDELKRTAA